MQNIIDRESHYSIFNRFVSVFFLLFISVVICVVWKLKNISKNHTQEKISYITRNVSHHINDIFHNTQDRLGFIAKLMADQNLDNDYYKIFHLVQLFSEKDKETVKPWGNIGWADINNIIRVNSHEILKTPIDLSYRTYINTLADKPFTLSIGKSEIDQKDSNKIIPVAMGINNQSGKFLGSLITNIEVNKIERYISEFDKDHNLHYALISLVDKDIIYQSDNFQNENHIQIIENILKMHDEKHITSKNAKEQQLNKFIKVKNNQIFSEINQQFYALDKLDNLPFAIIIGTNYKMIGYAEYLNSLITYKYELLIGLVILLMLTYLLYNSIINPFLMLSKAAEAISSGEDSKIFLTNINSKEGSLVARALEKSKFSFNVEKTLVQELSEVYNKLSVTNLRLENKVAERTKEVEQILKHKANVLDQLSHEIRLPLQGVASIAENLSSFWNDLTDSMKFEFTNQITHNTHRILLLVNNLLDLSHFSHNKAQLELTTFDVNDLIQEVITECKILYMHKKSITIHFNSDDDIHIVGDRERIGQVLRNLLINAIKHSPNQGTVAIKMMFTELTDSNNHRKCKAVHFIVYDRGTGINEEEVSLIFSTTPHKASTDNLWLGLRICYEIIRTHYGKIWAVNNKDGGSTFNFIVPISPPIVLELANNSLASRDLDPNNINVLMIDDEESSLSSMEMLLYGSEYNLIKCSSGQAGIAYLQKHYQQISIILLDLMMPDIYGLNLLSDIKNIPELAKIPVILQTGSSDEDEIVKAFNIGIASFIRKPYKKEAILREINKILRLYKLEKQVGKEKLKKAAA